MRSYQYKMMAWLRYVFAIGLAFGVFSFAVLFQISSFPYAKDKEYYLYSPSSQAEIKTELELKDLLHIKGERVKLETTDGEKYLHSLIARYAADVIKMEQFDGGTSYYCYSPKLKTPILLDGAHVNLHIVVKEKEMLIATPLVFGGY